jgi:hypothetical protein
MRMLLKFKLFGILAVLFCLCLASNFAAAASKPHYVITNDDVPPILLSSVSFYTISGNGGSLTLQGSVQTSGEGIGGGFFGENRLQILDGGKTDCVYASQAASSSVVGINIRTLKLASATTGSTGDTGASNGIGLAMNPQYLYASFSDVNTIGTFLVKPGCKLKFVGDTMVGGLQGGTIDSMFIRGNMMVVTYGDGSIESFNIAAGTPVSNGDEQNSTGSRGGNTYPSDIDITQDGHYAIFGDIATSTVIEVSDISSGKLTPTVVYRLGKAIGSGNILLSPDESLLYISNTQGDKITAAFFDTSTGVVSKGCASGNLRGEVKDWSYLGSLALDKTTGTGGTIYVAEFGAPSSIGEVKVTSAGGTCTLKELPKSPVSDPNSPGLLSIGSFPPRPF